MDLLREESLRRIKAEWSKLGRDPNLHEVAWLTRAKKEQRGARDNLHTADSPRRTCR